MGCDKKGLHRGSILAPSNSSLERSKSSYKSKLRSSLQSAQLMVLKPVRAALTGKDGNCPRAKEAAETQRLSAGEPGPNPGLEKEH